MELEPTGERMIVDHYHSTIQDYVIYLMHVASYSFAEQYTRGRRVLDYGCGSGWGSARIAESAAHVHAVDVSAEAVEYAAEKFSSPGIDFSVVEARPELPFDDGSFDSVLSFQVFEHVEDTDRYLSEVRRVLAPGGHLVLITPDRSTRLLRWQRPWNRFHLHEYSASQLRSAIGARFDDLEILNMSGRRDVIDVELKRCRKIRWVTLPVTLPIVPDRLRVSALERLHRARRGERATTPTDFGFDESAIEIGPGLAPSLNLVALARRSG
jgi:ubiquinone/menaquinone biosynthesis C-methylase UbiE